MRTVMMLLALMLGTASLAIPYSDGVNSNDQLVEGKDYQLLKNPGPTDNPDKLEVREFFFYGCPHCFHLEKALKLWTTTLADDVYLTKSPATLNPKWEPLGRAYHIAVALDKLPEIDTPLFNAIHLQKQQLFTKDKIGEFFAQYGVGAEEFDKIYNSFGISQLVKRDGALARQYMLSGVPAFVVNGKYMTSVTMTGSEERLFVVMNALLQKERAMKAAASAE